jgi:hypothetical protein
MVLGRAKGHERSAVKTETGQPVADALFRLRRYSPDGHSQFLERDSLVSAQGCKVLVDSLGFGCHLVAPKKKAESLRDVSLRQGQGSGKAELVLRAVQEVDQHRDGGRRFGAAPLPQGLCSRKASGWIGVLQLRLQPRWL